VGLIGSEIKKGNKTMWPFKCNHFGKLEIKEIRICNIRLAREFICRKCGEVESVNYATANTIANDITMNYKEMLKKSKEERSDIQDKILNAMGGMILILENENHPKINKFIDKFNLITSTLIKHGIIPDRGLYPKHE
jgi:acetone carboxylase gamma subunit